MHHFRRVHFVALFWSCSLFAAEFQIGPDISLDSLSLAAGDSTYLAVWRGLEPAPRIMGSLVSTTGAASAAFPVSDAAGAPLEGPVQRSTVAYDGSNFLVVWADNRTGGSGIRGALVTPQGGVLGGADFPIAPISGTVAAAPQCVFRGAGFLVAWQDAAQNSLGGTQIFYARVLSQGTAGPVSAVAPASGQGSSLSLEFLVAGSANEVLLVFQDLGASPNETRAVRVESDNSISGPAAGTLLFKQDFSPFGFGAPIGVAYSGGEYQVLSSYGTQIDSSVFRLRVLGDGTVIRPSASFAEVGQGTTGLAENSFPRTFYSNSGNNGGGEFLFVRNDEVSDTAYHLFTKRVGADGTDRDPNMTVVDSASQGVLNGAVAAGIGTQYLVAWMDGRRGGVQPMAQLNVYGFLVDDTAPTDLTKPYLKAVARANPIVGSAPLLVYFGTAGSSGIPDIIHWDFGDGTSADVGTTNHTYTSQGYYLAVLSVIRAGLAMRDFQRIAVDEDLFGGAGGPPQGVGGILGPVSNGVNTDVACNNLTVTLNFAKSSADGLRFSGYLDPSVMPVLATGKSGLLSIAGKTYSFATNVYGAYASDTGVIPIVRFGVNQTTGYFVLTVSSDDLRASFAALGAGDQTVPKPGQQLTIPFDFQYAGLELNSYVAATYTATAGKSGNISYLFGSSGYPGSGSFHIFGASAAQSGKTAKVHAFTVAGELGFGGNAALAKADSGNWRITLGNCSVAIPVASLVENSGIYTFTAAKGKTGITGFSFSTKNGNFVVVWKGVPADGDSPSGMLLASSPFWRADMAFSMDLALQDGAEFQGSAYVRLARKKLKATKWKLR